MIIESCYSDKYSNFRIPGIVCTNENSILLYYECRRPDWSDWGDFDIAVRRSTDGGKSFSDRNIVVHGCGKTVNNPVMFVDNSCILFMWMLEYSRMFTSISIDDGKTFGVPTEVKFIEENGLGDYTVLACGPGHGTVLNSGRYAVPIWYVNNKEDVHAHSPSALSTIYSDDKGKHWHIGERIMDKQLINPSESTISETENGDVLINIRNENPIRQRFIGISRNGCKSFEQLHFDETLIDPICCAGSVSNKRTIWFSNCASKSERKYITIRESTNAGKGWSKGIMIDEYGGYSDLALSSDGTMLYIFYEHSQPQSDKKHLDLYFYSIPTSHIK